MKNVLMLIVLSVVCAVPVSGQEWQTVTSREGHFNALFPGAPEIQTSLVENEENDMIVHSLILEQGPRAFAVHYTDYPVSMLHNANIDTFMYNVREGVLESVNGTLLSEESFVADTVFSGRSYRIDLPEGNMMRMRLILVRQRLFQILAAMPADDGYSPEIIRFMDSVDIEYEKVQPYIPRMLDSLEYTYDVDENGRYQLTLGFDDERSQLLYISPTVSAYTRREVYDIWSYALVTQDSLKRDLLTSLMKENGTMDGPRFQLYESEGVFYVVFSAIAEESHNADTFTRLLHDVAIISDDFEEQLMGGDDY